MKWDAKQYLKFEKERTQPAVDLINRLTLKNPKRILDIGCGPGNSTRLIKDKYPEAYVLGIDKSPEMIETAKTDNPDIDFLIADAGEELEKTGSGYDIVLSSAAIQWIPNHKELMVKMLSLLNPGGMLAVQVPLTDKMPMYQKIMPDLLASPEWGNEFAVKRFFHTLEAEQYYDLFSEISSDFTMWETVYYHRMDSCENIMEWYRGTGLRPYLEQLTLEKAELFEKEICNQLDEYYSKQIDGAIILKFPRLFFTVKSDEISENKS
ncbi:Trans-aconitate 2-methyltransferase [Methanimicrococcus hongohii]|uniref:Trans-aconitate 2-methyltransferase n=1 Tax=Methanimicrococcus hongohii TaxID=3028295 RepID=A0AA96ZSY7_9EURY|nr:methyltransferase domain-containing protein [Methanimicrococcus sp. Hf6]WNY23989.1 Trans-aconitate 2-methyltransferase [Methanimicrococcus sp. Hf6]